MQEIARVLGVTISDRPDIRLPVMAALRKLINYVKENDKVDDLQEIARFDKNYLPILFNVYTTKPSGSDEEGQRLAALDTIKVFLTVAKPELKQQLFNQALERLGTLKDAKEPNDLFLKESVLDLIRVLIPYQDLEGITTLFDNCIKPLPELKDKEQKKAYRLLEDICASETEGCKQFVKENRKVVQKMLIKSLNSSSVFSKGARLRCLNYLIKAQPILDYESKLIKSTIPEAILCCKDVNEKCRLSAYNLLNTIGEILQSHKQTEQFLGMVLIGLVGTPQMISATILALSSILHNFSGSLGLENINLIFENITKLLSSPTRDIAGSCLSFLKVYSKSLPSPLVGASLPKIVKSLCEMTEDCKRHFRLKVRDLLSKLVRKYGSEAIKQHIPPNDAVMYKRLRNIRKSIDRKKREKSKEKEEEEEGMDQDDFTVKPKNRSIEEILADSDSESEHETEEKNKRKKISSWIHEDADSIVDFTDPSVTSKIRATNPSKTNNPITAENKKKKDKGFKTAEDGRLIINDSSDSEEENKKAKGYLSFSDSDEDSDQDDKSTAILSNRKRKWRSTDSVKSGVSSKSGQLIKYKPGGSGIHRPVSVPSSTYSGAGSEYKAKKAGGDLKRKGKNDPYAYLPLKRAFLNKRKKAKLQGQFKNIVKSAKTGAAKGAKANRRMKKKL